MNTPVKSLELELIEDPSVSFWLKEQISKIGERDILDSLTDAEALVSLLNDRLQGAFDLDRLSSEQ